MKEDFPFHLMVKKYRGLNCKWQDVKFVEED